MPSVGTITGTLRLIDLFSGPLNLATINLGKTATKTELLAAKMSKVGNAMSLSLTLPLVAASGAAFKFAADFQEAMTKVETLSGAGRENVQGWRDDLLALAVEAGRAPQELAEALFFLSSSGLETSQVMEVLAESAKAAAIGMGDTEMVAGATTVIMNAFSKSGITAKEVINTMALAVKAGNADVSDFTNNMGRLASLASGLGIRFDDLSGVMSVMSRTNLDLNEVTTSLVQIMSSLLGTGKQGEEVLESIGVSFSDLRNIASGPGGLVAVLRLVDENLSLEEAKKAFPNIRAYRGLMNVLAQDADSVAEVMAEVASGVDVVGVAFDRVAEDPGFRFNQMVQQLKVDLIALGGSEVFVDIVDQVRFLLKALGELFEWFGKLPGPIKDFTTALILSAAVIGPLLRVVAFFTSGLSKLGFVVQGVSKAFTALLGTSAIGGAISTFKNASSHTGSLSFAMKETLKFIKLWILNWGVLGKVLSGALKIITGPIGWIVSLAAMALSFKSVRDALSELWDATEKYRVLAVEIVKVLMNQLVNTLKGLWIQLQKSTEEIFKQIDSALKLRVIWVGLHLVIDSLVNRISDFVKGLAEADSKTREWLLFILGNMPLVGPILSKVAGGYEELAKKAAGNLVIQEHFAGRGGLLEKMNKELKEWADGLNAVIPPMSELEIVQKKLNDATAKWNEFVEESKTKAEKFREKIAEIVSVGKLLGKSQEEINALIAKFIEQAGILPKKLEKLNTALEKWAKMDLSGSIKELIDGLTELEEVSEKFVPDLAVWREFQEQQQRILDLWLAGFITWEQLEVMVNQLTEEFSIIETAQEESNELAGAFAKALAKAVLEADNLADALQAVFSTQAAQGFTNAFKKLFNDLANIIDIFKTNSGSSIKSLFLSIKGSLIDFAKEMGTTQNAIAAGFAATSGESKDLMIGAMSAISAFAQGNYVGAIIAALGVIKGAFGNAAAKLKEDMEKFFKSFDAGTASVQNVNKAVNLLIKGISTLKEKVALRFIKENFDELVDAALRLGGTAVDSLEKLIQKMKSAGIGAEFLALKLDELSQEAQDLFEERSQFIQDQVSMMLEGIDKMALKTEGSVRFAATSMVQAFNALVSAGVSILEIADILAEKFGKVSTAAGNLKIDLPEAFTSLADFLNKISEGPLRKVIESLQGVGAAAEAAGNLGVLTFEQFNFLGKKLIGTYNKLIEGGLSHNEALAAIAPQLQLLNDLSEQYGFTVGSNTKKLLDEAKSLDLVTDKGLTMEDILIKGFDRMLEALNRIIVALGGVPVLFDEIAGSAESTASGVEGAWGKAAEETWSAWVNTTKGIKEEWQGLLNFINGGGGGLPSLNSPPLNFNTGSGGVQNFGSGTLAMLHGPEQVITIPEINSVQGAVAQALRSAQGSGNPIVEMLLQNLVELNLEAHRQREEGNTHFKDMKASLKRSGISLKPFMRSPGVTA